MLENIDSQFGFGTYYYGCLLWLSLYLLTTFVKAGVIRIISTDFPLVLLPLLLVLGQ